MNRILMGNERDVGVVVVGAPFFNGRRYTGGYSSQWFRRKHQIERMVHVCLEFSGENLRECCPTSTCPALAEMPLSEPFVHLDQAAAAGRNRRRRFDRTVQRRSDDRTQRETPQPIGNSGSLASTRLRESEAGEVGIDDVLGVLDFTMSDEVYPHGPIFPHRASWTRRCTV
jgi:hypothetical protein